jgi:dimethylargininase
MHYMTSALVRPVSRSIQECELTHMNREPICYETARSQHETYVQALRSLGVRVIELDPLHHHPDAVFVEDIAVVCDDIAILTRPGAESRRGEVESIIDVLSEHRIVAAIKAPGTLEGGDVLQIERTFFIGRSSRTNDEGIDQFRALVAPHGYQVIGVKVPGALHLKTAATYLGNGQLLANPEWIDMDAFASLELIAVHPDEPFAGNVVRIGDVMLFPERFTHTAGRLEARGLSLVLVPSSELAKAEGSLTCKSVVFTASR